MTRSDAGAVVIRYRPGAAVLDRDVDGKAVLSFADADHLASPGELDLPMKVVRVGIPQSGGVRVEHSIGPERVHESIFLRPAHAVSAGTDVPGAPAQAQTQAQTGYEDDPLTDVGIPPAARQHALAEGPLVSVSEVQMLRDVRFVEVRVRPARYETRSRRLRTYEWVEVSVHFEGNPERVAAADPLDPLIREMLVNGEQAVYWKTGAGSAMSRASFFDRAPHWVKVKVESAGVYRITGQDLRGLGVSIGAIDPATLALYSPGRNAPNGPYPDTMVEVPVFLTGDEDGRFDQQDKLVFYGQGADYWSEGSSGYFTNLCTKQNVYWLAWGGGPGRRIIPAFGPDTTGAEIVGTGLVRSRLEKDLDCPARSGLLWVWRTILKDSYRESAKTEVDLELVYPVTVNRLSGRFYSESGDNRVDLYLNRRLIDTLRFGAAGAGQPFDFTTAVGQPANFSANHLVLELRGGGTRKVYLDFFEVEYTRRLSLYRGQLSFQARDTGRFRFEVRDCRTRPFIFDVTDPYAPRMIDGAEVRKDTVRFSCRVSRPVEFLVAEERQLLVPAAMSVRSPGRLRSGGSTADYWIVTPAEFLAGAQKLARFRAGNVAGIADCRTAVAVLEEIYDDYAFGLEEPGALKTFFADKRPAYGLLCGDATYDYRNNLGRAEFPSLPSYQVGFGLDPSGVSALSTLSYDSWYADFEGAGGSPDMVMGRITCRSGQELSRFADKVIAFESGPAGMWNRRLLLLADDEWLGDAGRSDPIGFTHIRQAEGIGMMSGGLLDPVKVYLTEYPFTGSKSKAKAREELMRELRRGALAWVFFGHGDAFDLCHESVLHVSQIEEAVNGHRSPFCYFGSCSVGRFEDTRFECIAEELVRKPDGGAIATVGATRATASGANEAFARAMFNPLLRDSSPLPVVGAGFFTAWPMNRLYHLFGDPATRFRRPVRAADPLAVRPETLQSGARLKARIVQPGSAEYAWAAFGPRRYRVYSSARGETSYLLPGLELARGAGRVAFGGADFEAVFPIGVPLDTTFVGDGFYAPVPNSCRVNAAVFGPGFDLSSLADNIPLATEPAASADSAGPRVEFLHFGRRLNDGAEVPAQLDLEVVVTDSSGVLVCPVPGHEPRFFRGGRANETLLSDVLVFDEGTTIRARCGLPVKFADAEETLTVMVSDNLLNRTISSVVVQPLARELRLAVDSLLVYPNPVSRNAVFTFYLNKVASVRLRVYTMQGRLVSDLGERPAGYGYNQVSWDGKDRDGVHPANGVYLVALHARAAAPGSAEAVTARERFIVLR